MDHPGRRSSTAASIICGTWITTPAEQGVHERTAQQLAGHADGRMTREIYTHVTDTMLREAGDAIERVVADLDVNGSRDDTNGGNDEAQER